MPRYSVKVFPGVRIYGGRSRRRKQGSSGSLWILFLSVAVILVVGGVIALLHAFGFDNVASTTQPPLTPSSQPTTTTRPKRPVHKPNPDSIGGVPVAALGINSLQGSGGPVQVVAISCWSVGNCVAGGNFDSNSVLTYQTPFLANEKAGHWLHATDVPGIWDLPDFDSDGEDTTISWIHCFPGGNCSAGGVYSTSDWLDSQLFVMNDVRGTWFRAIAVPGLNRLNTGSDASFTSVACPSKGNCIANGTYDDSNMNQHEFSVREVGGVWQPTTTTSS